MVSGDLATVQSASQSGIMMMEQSDSDCVQYCHKSVILANSKYFRLKSHVATHQLVFLVLAIAYIRQTFSSS